ncbi:hypothetical protein W97_00881 [Coniosporium apollinis CBS 100218]|uniref:Protein kinase domain-containing protein n=1 Tax=Coniosporium apollinis (strain CBS 100218) TaxID=1168221 RepID=R7YID5_CONA1|nr:uncharacterized protein W97_00881 [Coniosporium apollinis CBS 100218]EON61665.1 hypothetical protein W97_00881 [Coniosporium apollinis CBS 100218]
MASHGDPASSHLYDALADLAPLKGSATHLSEPLSNHQRRKLLNLQDECFQIHNQDDPSTMAVWSKEVDDSTVKEAVFIEFKSYRNHDGDRDDKVRDDVLRLGKLLHDPKTPVRLHTRTCYGLTEDIDKGRIGFVYKLPWRLDVRGSHAQKARALTRQMPCSLESVIKTEQAPPLGDRFGLAKKLLEGVMLMHATGWVHKNIRSTSIMFFRKCPVSRSTPPFNWESPYLMGWGFSRSENFVVNVTRGGAEVGGSTQEHRIELDIYQHPDKRMDPYRRYQHAYDIYSLGLVLLELGLWKSLTATLPSAIRRRYYAADDERFPEDYFSAHGHILKHLQPLLVAQCGSIYASVVKAMLNTKSTKLDIEKQQQAESCLKLAAELSRCVA